MRITSQFLLNNFRQDQQKVNQELKKVTEQIASGKKIQNGYDDPAIFNDSLKFDTHINELKGVQERTQKALNFADATDSALQEFTNSIRTFKNSLIRAASDTHNADNREAIATALEKEKSYMMTLANTQVAGQYIFAGSATSVKPVDANGNYQGNGAEVQTVLGEGVSLAYNVDGVSLFLGSDEKVHKTVSTNISLKTYDSGDSGEIMQSTSKLSDLTGDDQNPFTFKISGFAHDGSVVKKEITLQPDATMQNLLDRIGEAYGNTPDQKKVDVSLDTHGHIRIQDLKSGMSQLELKLRGEQNGNVLKFNESGYTLAVPGTPADPVNDDSAFFVQRGNKLEGNVTLIADGKLATPGTKLSEIANGSLDGKAFRFVLKDINGTDQTATLNLYNTNGSTLTINGTTYNIYDAEQDSSGSDVRTTADSMTLGQLDDVIAMVLSGKLPASNDKAGYDIAIAQAKKDVHVTISQSGKLQIENKANDKALEFAFFDVDAADMDNTTPSFALMSNDAVTTQKPEMDFFYQLDEIIAAVRNGSQHPESDNANPRNIGLQDAIAQLDQFDSHFNKNLAKTGVIQKSLTNAQDRAQSMELSIKELKSELTDVDIAEAYMNLNQLSLSYQAILSSVTKVNALTLLNYMK